LRSEHIGLTGVANFVALAVYFGELIEQVDIALVYFELRIFVRQPMKGARSAENSRRPRRLRPSLLVPGSDFFLKSGLPAGA
jgi:hypothetical protein